MLVNTGLGIKLALFTDMIVNLVDLFRNYESSLWAVLFWRGVLSIMRVFCMADRMRNDIYYLPKHEER